MKAKLVTLILSLTLFFLLAAPALAQGPDGNQVVFGRDLVLQAEETIDGDVAVFGGNVVVPEGSEINGDLAVFGGNARIDGVVDGDIAMIGGNINLGSTGVVNGNIGLVGGDAKLAEGAEVEGDINNLNRFGWDSHFEAEIATPIPPVPPVAPEVPATPVPPATPVRPVAPAAPGWDSDHGDTPFSGVARSISNFIGHVVGNITLLLALAALSWLVAAFLPEQMRLVGDTLVDSAPLSFVVGIVTMAVAGLVGLVLLITICLAFVPILGGLVLGIALLFGWIAAGQVIGERLVMASGRPVPNFVLSTMVGVTVLTIVAKMPIISQIPCLGFILGLIGGVIGFVVSMAGLGAVILTRFGTQPYAPQPHSFRPTPPSNPGPGPSRPRPASYDSPLDRSEAELRAKIKAALAEAEAEAGRPAPTQPVVEDQPIDDEPVAEEPGDTVIPSPAEPPVSDLPLETPPAPPDPVRPDDDPERPKTGE